VSVLEAARRLGIGKTLLYAQIGAGTFPHRRIDGRIVVTVRVIEQFAKPDGLMNRSGLGKPNNSALMLVLCV